MTAKHTPPPMSAGPRMIKTALVFVCLALAVWLCVEIGAGIMRASLEIGALAEAAEVAARW